MCENWYVIQVRSGKEEEIKNTCQRMISSDVLQECFIPRCIRLRKKQGSWQESEEILFKGYLFMVTDQIENLFNKLKLIPDLTKVLGNDGEYICPIIKDEARFLMEFGRKEHVVKMSQGHIIDNRLLIVKGPLVGYENKIRKIDRHKRVAFIEVSLFDQVQVVQVGLDITSKNS